MNKNWSELNSQLENVIKDEIAAGRECGCQLCIFEHGNVVINIAAGFTSPEKNTVVTKDSLFPIFSTGKALLAALAWKMVEKGFISYDTPVCELWKDFNTPDKCGITLEHLLSHRAGLYLLPNGGKCDVCNWEEMCNAVAAMPARNLPGEKCHYHPLTFGWLVGHTLELATGIPLPELMLNEILIPAGISDSVYFGIPEDASDRVVPIDDTLIPEKPAWEALHMNNPDIRRICIPSFNGIGSAFGLAKFYSQLRGKLVSNETFDYATGKLFRSPADPVLDNQWTRFAMGTVLRGPQENIRMFIGHGGAAGAEAFYMPDENIALAFVKNRLSPNHPDHPVRDRISEVLDIPTRFW